MNNQNDIEELESLEPVQESPKKNYDAEINSLLNSVTMADLVSPEVVKKKKKKKFVIVVVILILVIGVVGVVLLNNGTLSKITQGPTTNELDVFKTETTNTKKESSSDVGKYTRIGNSYTLDTTAAANGKTVKYYLTSTVTLYITYAEDYETSGKYTININKANYTIEQEGMGTLTVNISDGYIVYSNSNESEQKILSNNGLLFEEDPSINTSNVIVTTTQVTTTTHPTVVKTFNFPNTRDANGRTTHVESVYDATLTDIDYVWVDEDGVAHVVFIGSEESRLNHPELYENEEPEETEEPVE